MKLAFIVFIFFSFWACSKDTPVEPSNTDLLGAWVNSIEKTDTLYFEKIGDKVWINLRRGTEIVDGNELPKPNSGYYTYYFKDGRIYLNWSLSSNSKYYSYYFRYLNSDHILIGDFYGDYTNSTLNFYRIKN